ncbi:hypothetical protein QE408_001928 [Agrobacterium larrymoorei]|uniref:Uncharacterized protein n=1 Tax=Agrobacterium larrymoorei TaxID=160699 RepID=A0ABU0UIK9_9HYPH|nr:hypothetical protein [Agrobacterium larrymoorei]
MKTDRMGRNRLNQPKTCHGAGLQDACATVRGTLDKASRCLARDVSKPLLQWWSRGDKKDKICSINIPWKSNGQAAR